MLAMAMMPSVYDVREADWRNGAIVYQIFVDRFGPPADVGVAQERIRGDQSFEFWSNPPVRGEFDPEANYWSHELVMWGGTLRSAMDRLDHVARMRADVVYLMPIFEAETNHKYDTTDYFRIDPAYGSLADFHAFRDAVHEGGMALVLDGVFNHAGTRQPVFQRALDGEDSVRDWFTFSDDYAQGYRSWTPSGNLPIWNLKHEPVRDYLWNDEDSVVRHWLREGIDGWRLDVAFELGPEFLAELREAARQERDDAWVVGEISGYPAEWFGAVDGTFDWTQLQIVARAASGEISGGRAGRMLAGVVRDAGIENLLKTWTLIDNHDTPRAIDQIPSALQRRMVQTFQFTLPGSPVIYQGSELGQVGAGDPECRAPMAWSSVEGNPELAHFERLTALRQEHRALKIGDLRSIETDRLLGFARTTDKLGESVIVLANPTGRRVEETVVVPLGRLMSWGEVEDVWTGERWRVINGLLTVDLAAYRTAVLRPVVDAVFYERIP